MVMKLSNSVNLIARYSKNNVIPLSYLKKSNYPIFKYLLNNYKFVLRQLKENGYTVLNDLHTLNNLEKIKRYLLCHYGESVNMTLLRISDPTLYNYLSNRGKPGELVEKMGFTTLYARKSSNTYIKDELFRLSDGEGNITKIADAKLYSKIYYRAKKQNISLDEYFKTHGFTYHKINMDEVYVLRSQGKSFSEISESIGIPLSTIHRRYSKNIGGELHD